MLGGSGSAPYLYSIPPLGNLRGGILMPMSGLPDEDWPPTDDDVEFLSEVESIPGLQETGNGS